MLAVLSRLGGDRFAIETRHIVEIIPMVKARQLGPVQPWLLGLFNHRGRLLPLVDTGIILSRGPIPVRMHSRIIVCRIDLGTVTDPGPHCVGLLVEELLGVDRLEIAPEGLHPGLTSIDGVGLGSLMVTNRGELQLIDPSDLFSVEQRALLFHQSPVESRVESLETIS